VTDRSALLARIADLLQRDREQLAHTESLDTGKTLNEARADVDDTTAVFRYYAGVAGADAGRVVDPGRANVTSRITMSRWASAALIAPWNYPLLQISWKLAPALAAGNTAVVKPSELTPLSTVALTGLFEEADLPPGVLNLLLGQGGTAGQAPGRAPGRGPDLLQRRPWHRREDHGRGGARSAAGGARARRQEPQHRVRRQPTSTRSWDNALTGLFLPSGQVCSAVARVYRARTRCTTASSPSWPPGLTGSGWATA